MLKFKVLNRFSFILVGYNHKTLSGYSLSLVKRKLSACKIPGCHDNKRMEILFMVRLGHRSFRFILLRNQVFRSLMETPGNKLLTARPANP